MLYQIVIGGSNAVLLLSLYVAVRFIARQITFRWSRKRKGGGEKMSESKIEGTTDSRPTNHPIFQDVGEREQNETFSPFWMHQSRFFPGDYPFLRMQNFHGSLRPGGREFSLLRLRNPICESAGWTAIF